MTTAYTPPRGRVWRETWTTHSSARGLHATTVWRWGIGTWHDGEAENWQDALRQCTAAVDHARRTIEPPF